jgi:hypothetical protein
MLQAAPDTLSDQVDDAIASDEPEACLGACEITCQFHY